MNSQQTVHSPASARLSSAAVPVQRGITLSLTGMWHRVVLAAIVLLAAVLDFAGLSTEGYSNEYYAAAIKSMSENWHNFFFNAFDPGGFVTIDKPPLGFWFQVASVKLFGFNGVALLIPQALAGVLSVALLYRLVSRTFGRTAGLIAAFALAVTPISVVTNRNNTIDSTLVLCVLLGAWAVLRAAETGRLRWLLLCAAFVGLGFNIKMLEAYLVLPAFVLVYLLGARVSVPRRILHLALAGLVLAVVSFSWIMAVDLTPASDRPWVDSTTTNSELDLAIGYNGLQRLTGNHSISSSSATAPRAASSSAGTGGSTTRTSGSSAARGATSGGPGGNGGPGSNGGPGGVGENGPTGPLRFLDTQLGSQIGWLLPLAILGFLVGLWQTRPRFRTLDDRQRSLALWGVWLLTTGAFFSVALFFHTYYLVMVAPAMSALAGIGVVSLWTAYRQVGSRTWWLLPLGLLLGAAVEVYILRSYPSWSSWLSPIVIGAAILAAVAAVAIRLLPGLSVRLAAAATLVGVAGLLAAPAAFAAQTAQHTETGNIVRAGPTASGTQGGFGGPGGGQGGPGASFGGPPSGNGSFGGPPTGSTSSTGTGSSAHGTTNGTAPSGRAGTTGTSRGSGAAPPAQSGSGSSSSQNGAPPAPPSGSGAGGPPAGGPPPGGFGGAPPSGSAGASGSGQAPTAGSSTHAGSNASGTTSGGGQTSGRTGGFSGFGGQRGGFGAGGPGGNGADTALVHYLVKHRGTATYLVATDSSNSAAPIILATGDPVMSLGGFSGSDPILTTSQFAKLVKKGVVRYYLAGGMGGGGFGGSNSIASWVTANCTAVSYSSTSTGSLYRCGSSK